MLTVPRNTSLTKPSGEDEDKRLCKPRLCSERLAVMAKTVALILCGLALFAGILSSTVPVAASSSSIPIEPCSWDHTLLTVRMTPGTGVTNYQDSYLTAARAGIDNWRRTIQVWMDMGGPVYMGQLQFEVFVTSVNDTLPSYDVEVRFVASIPSGAAGQTSVQCPNTTS